MSTRTLKSSAYSYILEDYLMPLHNAVRGRRYVRHTRFLLESQWWPREQVLRFQWQELQKLLKLAFEEVPYYRKKYASAGVRLEDIRSWKDFRGLPVLTREDVTQNREELFPENFKGKRLPHATGGSSGVPLRFYKTIESYDWRSAATRRVYGWSGYRTGERCLYLWGAPVGRPPLLSRVKTRLHNAVNRCEIIPTFVQNDSLWQDAYTRAQQFQPRFLVGYVSSVLRFARYIESEGLKPPKLRAILGAAEPLQENVRAYINGILEAPMFNTYGSREFMSIAGECERHAGMHVNAENVVVETRGDPGEGPSEILVTDLHNLGTVFIRYAIGDLGVLSHHACDCGRSLPMLESVQGRTVDALKLADGQLVSGLFFCHTLKEIPEVLEYQVQQTDPKKIVVSVVLANEISEKSRVLFSSEMKKAFGDTEVELKPVQEIPKSSAGKLRSVVGLS